MPAATDGLLSPLLHPAAAAKNPAGDSKPENLSIDEMLRRHCGELGPWQLRHFVLTSLAWALEAFHTMVMIFADREPDWRCLDGSGCDPTARSVCGLQVGSWEWVGGPSSSTVAEWGLFCGEKYKVGLVQAIFFGGCMIGAGIFGHLSDSFLGRKGSLTIVCLLNTIFGCLTAFSPNFTTYLLLRLLTGFSTGGVGLCAFVLATEPVGPTKRGVAGMSTFYFFSTGIAILAAVAFAFPHWRPLYLASSLPSLLFLLLILPFLSESPRWYLVRGRTSDAMKIMSHIAARNGNHLPDNITLALDDDNDEKENMQQQQQQCHEKHNNEKENMQQQQQCHEKHNNGKENMQQQQQQLCHEKHNNKKENMQQQQQCHEKHKDEKETMLQQQQQQCHENYNDDAVAVTGSIVDVVRSPLTRVRLFLAVAINFLCSVVYYGLSLNVVNLETNIYMNVVLNAVAEMPAFTITAVLLDRFGRKPMAIGTLWFSGVFCLLGSLMENVGMWKVVKMVCGILGIFGMAGTYNLLFIYTAELFPTVVRNAALGCATQAAQMGAILAPFVVVLGGGLPFAVFAACGLVAGVLGFYLPETMDQPLYDTFAGMVNGGGCGIDV